MDFYEKLNQSQTIKNIYKRLRALEHNSTKIETVNHTPQKISHQIELDLLNIFLDIIYPLIFEPSKTSLESTLDDYGDDFIDDVNDLLGDGADIGFKVDWGNSFKLHCNCEDCYYVTMHTSGDGVRSSCGLLVSAIESSDRDNSTMQKDLVLRGDERVCESCRDATRSGGDLSTMCPMCGKMLDSEPEYNRHMYKFHNMPWVLYRESKEDMRDDYYNGRLTYLFSTLNRKLNGLERCMKDMGDDFDDGEWADHIDDMIEYLSSLRGGSDEEEPTDYVHVDYDILCMDCDTVFSDDNAFEEHDCKDNVVEIIHLQPKNTDMGKSYCDNPDNFDWFTNNYNQEPYQMMGKKWCDDCLKVYQEVYDKEKMESGFIAEDVEIANRWQKILEENTKVWLPDFRRSIGDNSEDGIDTTYTRLDVLSMIITFDKWSKDDIIGALTEYADLLDAIGKEEMEGVTPSNPVIYIVLSFDGGKEFEDIYVYSSKDCIVDAMHNSWYQCAFRIDIIDNSVVEIGYKWHNEEWDFEEEDKEEEQ